MKRIVVSVALMLPVVLSAASGEPGRARRTAPAQIATYEDPTARRLLDAYDPQRPTRVPRPYVALKMATWNTMLQPWLPYEANVIAALEERNVDVLVLQEVWSEEARDRIRTNPTIAARFPYFHWVAARQDAGSCPLTLADSARDAFTAQTFVSGPSSPAAAPATRSMVTEATVNDYIACLIGTGTDTRTVEQPVLPTNILCQFLGLNISLEDQPCHACLDNTMQELPSGNPGAYGARDSCFQGTGAGLSHQGNVGMLILSKLPLQNVQEIEFDTYSIRRVNVYATIGGVRVGFAHWPHNVFFDIDTDLGPFQSGALQPALAQDMLNAAPKLILGDFNSGPDYQPDGVNLLMANKYHPLFSTPTQCTAELQDFPPCGDFNRAPTSTDNIFMIEKLGACNTTTFAADDGSDHIGLETLCIVKMLK